MAVRKRTLKKSGGAAKSSGARYDLRLYVTGQTPRSLRSVQNLTAICNRYLPGRFDLQVVDLYQQPALAAENQVVAAPTLIKAMPLPLRRLVGDLSDEKRVLAGLGLELSAA
jgi:circadian clock protein KaiB